MYRRDLFIEMLSHCKRTFGSWIFRDNKIFLHKLLESLSNVIVWRLESLFHLAFLRIFAFPYYFLAGAILICRDVLERALLWGRLPYCSFKSISTQGVSLLHLSGSFRFL